MPNPRYPGYGKLDYAPLRIWLHESGSYPYYISGQVERARETHAPQDALYEETGPAGLKLGTWRCVSDLPLSHGFRDTLEKAGVKV